MVIGLAFTHLILGLVGVIQTRAETKIYWIHLVWVVFVTDWLVEFWWFFFQWRDLAGWTPGIYRFFLGYALTLSLVAGLLFPIRGGVSDFRIFFFKHARWFFGLLLLANVFDMVEVYLKADFGIRDVPVYYVPSAILSTLGLLIAAFTKNERYHAVFGALALLWAFGYTALVFGAVG